jgi:hypothetical protein
MSKLSEGFVKNMSRLMEAVVIAGGVTTLVSGANAQPVDAHARAAEHPQLSRHYPQGPASTAQIEVLDASNNQLRATPTDFHLGKVCVKANAKPKLERPKLYRYTHSSQSVGSCALGDKAIISVVPPKRGAESWEPVSSQTFKVTKKPFHLVFMDKVSSDNGLEGSPLDGSGSDGGSFDYPPGDGYGDPYPDGSGSDGGYGDLPPTPSGGSGGSPPPPSSTAPLLKATNKYLETLDSDGQTVVSTDGSVKPGQIVLWDLLVNNFSVNSDGSSNGTGESLTISVTDQLPTNESFGLLWTHAPTTTNPKTGAVSWTESQPLGANQGASIEYETIAGPNKSCGISADIAYVTGIDSKGNVVTALPAYAYDTGSASTTAAISCDTPPTVK